MTMATFFDSTMEIGDVDLMLDENELLHARQSRRLKLGSRVRVLNGRGLVAEGKIKELGRRTLHIAVEKNNIMPAPAGMLSLAVAIPKGDRQRFMVESLTQLGVSNIQPLEYERSVLKNSIKATVKWQRYAIEAIKQSQNPWLPQVYEPLSLSQWMKNHSVATDHLKIVADASGVPFRELIADQSSRRPHIVAIGPEGGFTPQEKERFEEAGFVSMSLGANILRTEVAAISYAAQWQSLIFIN